MTRLTDSLGYRAKIGVLMPATNTTVQPEYEALRPPGVTDHIARVPNRPRPLDDEGYRRTLEIGPVNTEDALDRSEDMGFAVVSGRTTALGGP